jgi:hypothetical protein
MLLQVLIALVTLIFLLFIWYWWQKHRLIGSWKATAEFLDKAELSLFQLVVLPDYNGYILMIDNEGDDIVNTPVKIKINYAGKLQIEGQDVIPTARISISDSLLSLYDGKTLLAGFAYDAEGSRVVRDMYLKYKSSDIVNE